MILPFGWRKLSVTRTTYFMLCKSCSGVWGQSGVFFCNNQCRGCTFIHFCFVCLLPAALIWSTISLKLPSNWTIFTSRMHSAFPVSPVWRMDSMRKLRWLLLKEISPYIMIHCVPTLHILTLKMCSVIPHPSRRIIYGADGRFLNGCYGNLHTR